MVSTCLVSAVKHAGGALIVEFFLAGGTVCLGFIQKSQGQPFGAFVMIQSFSFSLVLFCSSLTRLSLLAKTYGLLQHSIWPVT